MTLAIARPAQSSYVPEGAPPGSPGDARAYLAPPPQPAGGGSGGGGGGGGEANQPGGSPWQYQPNPNTGALRQAASRAINSQRMQAGPQNAYSQQRINQFGQQAIEDAQRQQRQFNAGAQQAAAARGVTGLDLGTLMGQQAQALGRGSGARAMMEADLAGQRQGVNNYAAENAYLSNILNSASGEEARQLQMLLEGVAFGQGFQVDPTTGLPVPPGTPGAVTAGGGSGYTTASERGAYVPLWIQQLQGQQALEQGQQGYEHQLGLNTQNFGHQSILNDQANMHETGMANLGYEHQTGLNDQLFNQDLVRNTQDFGHQTLLNDQSNMHQAGMAQQGFEHQTGLNNQSYLQQLGLNEQQFGHQQDMSREERATGLTDNLITMLYGPDEFRASNWHPDQYTDVENLLYNYLNASGLNANQLDSGSVDPWNVLLAQSGWGAGGGGGGGGGMFDMPFGVPGITDFSLGGLF